MKIKISVCRTYTLNSGQYFMIVVVTDPVTNNPVISRINKPFFVEGNGHNILKIYFENEDSREKYIQLKKAQQIKNP